MCLTSRFVCFNIFPNNKCLGCSSMLIKAYSTHLMDISKEKNVNFQGRFSYVQLSNSEKEIIKKPYLSFSDIFASMEKTEYDKVDSNELKWDFKLK